MTPRSQETTHPFQSPFSASHALGSCQPHSPETICAIHSTSHHIPTPLKSSQTHTLQILLPHQDSLSNPDTPVCSHTLRDFPTSSSILWSFFSKNDRRFRVLHVTPKLICTIHSQAPAGTSGKSFLPTATSAVLPCPFASALFQTSISLFLLLLSSESCSSSLHRAWRYC